MAEPMLFEPISIRGVNARNRVMISPMQMYAAVDGMAQAFHLVQLGRFGLGGAGIVIAEATGVSAQGRISNFDLGLWRDDQRDALKPVAEFLKQSGAAPGIQLVHSGRKGSISAPWHGGGPLTAADAERGDPSWSLLGPSEVAAGSDWPVPAAMTETQIEQSIQDWADAAKRAEEAGFVIIDLHGAHGYLLHSFLSPASNLRTDAWGGSAGNRMRYPLEVVRAIRGRISASTALFYRLSAVDGLEGGLTLDDTIPFCQFLLDEGVDCIDTSSGGVVGDRSNDTYIRRGYAFHAPYSAAIRKATGGLVATVGLVVEPRQAEAILRAGDADIIALGREVLSDPNWPARAARDLAEGGYDLWNQEARWWLEKRESTLSRLQQGGETPMTRYADLQ